MRLKLYTGSTRKPNNYIYDDSLGSAISENGRHEGVAVVIEGVELVFDNHHPNGIRRDEWLDNLQFHAKLWAGKSFEITEEELGR